MAHDQTFSGNISGKFISAIRPLFPDLLFMPTGGVNLDKENMAGGFKAGVCVVSMGSKINPCQKNLLHNLVLFGLLNLLI